MARWSFMGRASACWACFPDAGERALRLSIFSSITEIFEQS
jgi:hypothetical protein